MDRLEYTIFHFTFFNTRISYINNVEHLFSCLSSIFLNIFILHFINRILNIFFLLSTFYYFCAIFILHIIITLKREAKMKNDKIKIKDLQYGIQVTIDKIPHDFNMYTVKNSNDNIVLYFDNGCMLKLYCNDYNEDPGGVIFDPFFNCEVFINLNTICKILF